MLDGEQVQVTDSTGTPAEPFIINGTTYLPVANIARMLGLTVTWYMVAAAVALGVFVAYAAMFGFDKLREALEQITKYKN